MTEIETIAKGLTDGERERLLWGRRDWRDSEWEDHCGDPNCQKCTGYIPEPNISQIRKEDLAVRDYLKGQPCCQEHGGAGCHPPRCDICPRHLADAISRGDHIGEQHD